MNLYSSSFRPQFLIGTGFCFTFAAAAQLSERVFYSFPGGVDGQQPLAGLVQGSDGSLYGTTYMGGSNNAGTIFRVSPDGSGKATLYEFEPSSVSPSGLANSSGLIQGADGGLYGATGLGGSNGYGSVFRLNLDGSGYALLHSFSSSGGYEPTAGLVQGRDGTLFGTTQFGGNAGAGTIFSLSTNGTGFAQLYYFGAFRGDPRSPQASLLLGADGALYGTTSAGGASAVNGGSGYGTVFKINTDGTGQAVLHSFQPSDGDGQRSYAALVQGSDGSLYGTTQQGGSTANGGNSGAGTVFKLNPDGTGYKILHNFVPGAGDGQYPNSALALGNDGALYGTTESGGRNNLGAVFRLNPDGSDYAILYSFGAGPADGSFPKAPLVRAFDGGLFGTTQFGGDGNFGTIFRLAPAPTVILSVRATATGGVHLSFAGAPHFEYRIEGSTDQVHWAALTNVYNATGVMEYTDPEASSLSHRFYRTGWLP